MGDKLCGESNSASSISASVSASGRAAVIGALRTMVCEQKLVGDALHLLVVLDRTAMTKRDPSDEFPDDVLEPAEELLVAGYHFQYWFLVKAELSIGHAVRYGTGYVTADLRVAPLGLSDSPAAPDSPAVLDAPAVPDAPAMLVRPHSRLTDAHGRRLRMVTLYKDDAAIANELKDVCKYRNQRPLEGPTRCDTPMDFDFCPRGTLFD